MRPDPRLLLPASAVRRVPVGAVVWLVDSDAPRVVVHGWDTQTGRVYMLAECSVPSSLIVRPASDLHVDLSAPVPGERMDALGWAFDRLNEVFQPVAGWRAIRSVHVPGIWQGYGPPRETLYAVCYSSGSREYALAAPGHWPYRWPRRLRVRAVDPWPDLSGLTPDDAARAVVVAAIAGGARD